MFDYKINHPYLFSQKQIQAVQSTRTRVKLCIEYEPLCVVVQHRTQRRAARVTKQVTRERERERQIYTFTTWSKNENNNRKKFWFSLFIQRDNEKCSNAIVPKRTTVMIVWRRNLTFTENKSIINNNNKEEKKPRLIRAIRIFALKYYCSHVINCRSTNWDTSRLIKNK